MRLFTFITLSITELFETLPGTNQPLQFRGKNHQGDMVKGNLGKRLQLKLRRKQPQNTSENSKQPLAHEQTAPVIEQDTRRTTALLKETIDMSSRSLQPQDLLAPTTRTLPETTETPPRPSLEPSRSIRISLSQRQSSLSHFGSFKSTPIAKHYALNNQILTAFESNYHSSLWEVAFLFGLKFVETALLEIPQHGYFYAEKYAEPRLQSTVDTLRVCHMLQGIIGKEGNGKLKKETHKVELLYYLATEQYEHLRTYEASRKRVHEELVKAYPQDYATSNQKPHDSSASVHSISSTLMACGESFSSVFCPGNTTLNEEYNSTSQSFPDEVSAIAEEARRQRLYPSISSEARQPDESLTWRHSRKAMDSTRDLDRTPTSSLLDDDEEDKMTSTTTTNPNHPSTLTTTSLCPSLSSEIATGVPLDDASSSSLSRHGHPQDALSPSSRHSRTQSDYDLQRALFISGLRVDLPDHRPYDFREPSMGSISEGAPVVAPPGAKKRSSLQPALAILATCYHEDFDALRQRGRISVKELPTFQGRVPGSINGCAVIAPLLCLHHFVNEGGHGLPDDAIVQVIDVETPAILPVIRDNLGLVRDAFLIPADAHEALMQQNYMCAEQFLNATGGNILDEGHLESFIEELSKVGNKKLAASFFFHEHVITVLQLVHDDKKTAWFEVIDSLPHEDTFLQVGETSSAILSAASSSMIDAFSGRTGDGYIGQDSHASLRLESDRSGMNRSMGGDEFLVDHIPRSDAVRIRCMDMECLKATLMWYACSVFTEDNRAYIDTYEWDEKLADFDPRVFQAFIWTEAS